MMMSSEKQSRVEHERRLALVIGVNAAPQSHLEPLKYALNDAECMAKTLQEHCGFTLLQPPLLGPEATSANVKKAVLALARQRSDADFLLLYFSGHGQPMTVSGDQSDIYLGTSDFSATDTEEDENLHCSMRWLQEKLYLPTQAGKVLLVLDCCYAGNMGRTAPDPYLEDLKMRINKYFGAPGTASGARAGGLRLALTATGHNQSAYEQEGHGMLTGCLLECLQGKVDDVIDLDDRGNVSLQRLHDYLLRVMPKDQNPSVSGDYAGQKCILANYEQRAIELRQSKRAIVNEIPHTHIPLARSASFQQRPGEFDEVARLLFVDAAGGASPQNRVVGLIGMGGIGKTQLAVEIAYEYKERFAAGIFWMAATGASLSEWQHQFAELAANTEYLPPGDDVSHPEHEARRARHIARYLAHHPDALLLLDNVEHIAHLLDALTSFAGEEVHCTILYTSRTDVAPSFVNKYMVSKLPEKEALRLLLERRPALLKGILAGADDREAQAARAICQYVDYLPLALTLLRDLLQDAHLTLTHLHQQLRQHGALEITRDQDVTDAKLFSTFLLSWEKVRNPAAQRLFQLASFFPEAAPIPLWLLALAANLEGNTSIEPLGKARLELLRWSLIEELPGDALRLHPIIRECARYLVAQDNGRDALLATAGEHLANGFTDVNKLERRVLAEGYWKCLERVQEAVSYAQLLGIQQADVLERVAYWLARDSSLLGTGALWPQVLPGLFYQQLHNRALEEDYHLSGTAPDARWVRQQSRVGAEDQSLLREFRHPAGVTNVAFSPDNRLVATGCDDCRVRVWDVSSGQVLQTLQSNDTPITGVAFSPDGSKLVTCSLDTDAVLWNVLNGQFLRVIAGQNYALRDVAFSPDGKYIAAMSEDRFVRVWDVATGEMVAVLVEQSGWIGDFAFSPDSEQIAIISSDNIEIWDRESGQVVTTLKAKYNHRDFSALEPITERTTSHESNMIVLSGMPWSWELDKIKHLSIVFSLDGKSVLFSSQSNTYIWDIGQQEVSTCFSILDWSPFSMEYITGTAFFYDDKQIAVIRDNIVEVWQIQKIQNEQRVLSFKHSTLVTSVAFSPDGTKVVTGSSDGIARLWQVPFVPLTKREVRSYFELIECAVFSPAGTQLLTVGTQLVIAGITEGVVRVWDAIDGEIVRTLEKGSRYTDCAALSPDGKRVAMGEFGTIWIWNIEQNWDRKRHQEIAHYVPPDFPLSASMSCIVLSPDGMLVAKAANQIIQVWRLDTWKEVALLRGHEGEIKQMAFSPDSSRLVTGATDGTARVWDISSGTQLVVLKEYAGRSIGISSDGRMLAIGLFSNAVSIVSMENGERLMLLEGHTQPVTMLSFSPAGRFLLSADQSGQVLFWRVDADGRTTKTPMGMYLAANAIAAVYWQDEQHVILADLGGVQNRPHFYHLALEGMW
jgi:WD40 repeat protein